MHWQQVWLWPHSCEDMYNPVKNHILSVNELLLYVHFSSHTCFYAIGEVNCISNRFASFRCKHAKWRENPTSLTEVAWSDIPSLSKRVNIGSEYDTYNNHLPAVSQVHDGTWHGDPRYLHSANYSHWVSTKLRTTTLLHTLSLDTRLDIRNQKTGNRSRLELFWNNIYFTTIGVTTIILPLLVTVHGKCIRHND